MKYHRPGSLSNYRELTAELGGARTGILAGGTDLILGYESGLPLPDNLIDIKAIPELTGIHTNGKQTRIGALTTIEELRRNEHINRHYPALAMAADEFGSPQIRHRATVGGNIVNASPAGDTLPPLYIYGASVQLVGPEGERVCPIQSFIRNPGEVDLQPGELVTSINLPRIRGKSVFHKLALRRALAISVVNFAILYEIKNRHFSHLTVTAGAVAPRVVYLRSFTDAMLGNRTSLDQAIHLVDQDIAPIDDIRASAWYRRTVLKNLLYYTLNALLERKE